MKEPKELSESVGIFTFTTPDVAINAAGNAIAVWENGVGTQKVEAAVYNKNSGTWSNPFDLSPLGDFADEPRVQLDDNGFAIAVWENHTTGRIQAVRIEISTLTLSPIETFAGTGSRPHFPKISLDDAGNALVVWDDGLLSRRLYYSRYDVQTAMWTAADRITSQNETEEIGEISVDSLGNGVAIWQEFSGIKAAVFDENTKAWTPPIPISSAGDTPRVALSSSGTATLSWKNSTSVEVCRLHLPTLTVTPATAFSVVNFGLGFPKVATDGAGNALLIWEDNLAVGEYKLIFSRFDTFTNSWSAPMRITSQNDQECHGKIAMDPAGNAVVVFENRTMDSIQASFYDSVAATWQSPITVFSDITRVPAIAINSLGDVIALSDNRTTEKIQAAIGNVQTKATDINWENPEDISGPVGVITFTTPEVVANATGNAIAVWENAVGTQKVEAAVYLENAETWVGPFTLSPLGDLADEPRVALDDNGFAIVVFENQTLGVTQAVRINIFTQMLSPLESFFGTGTNPRFPKIAMDQVGNAIAIWNDNGTGSNRMYFSKYDVLTDTWSAAARISSQTVSEVEGEISMDPTGNAIVVWRRFSVIQATVLLKDSLSWTTPINVSSGGFGAGQRVALSQTGFATISWGNFLPPDSIEARRININTLALSPIETFLIVNFGSVPPEVVTDAKGNALLIWDENFAPGSNKLIFTRFDVLTNSWSSPERVTNQNANEINGNIDMDCRGNAVLIWENRSDDKIQTAYYDGIAKVWREPSTISSAVSRIPDAAISPCGHVVAIWDNRTMDRIQAAIGLVLPYPPRSLKLEKKVCRLPTQSTCQKFLTWGKSLTPVECLLEYRIFRNGKLIGTVPATGPFLFDVSKEDKKGATIYKVVAVSIFGETSVAASAFCPFD